MPPLQEQPNPSPIRRTRPVRTLLVVFGSLAITLILVAHAWLPDAAGLGLLVDSGLIWLGIFIPILLLLAVSTRRKRLTVLALAPTIAWSLLFIPGMVPLMWSAPQETEHSLSVASQNVRAESGTAAESAAALASAGPEVLALQEVDGGSRAAVDAALAPHYAYSYRIGTVGLWSDFPIINATPLGLGLGWNRALFADLQTPGGLVRVYVIHAASARPAEHADRDTMLANLAATIAADSSERIIAMGDFNATSTDRHFAALARLLDEPRQDQGLSGFTWPASPVPLARLDHILQRGMAVTSNSVIKAGDSDHLAVRSSFNL